MATSREFLNYVLDQLSCLDEISCRAMMGEYVLYYRGKVVGGLYDNQLLLKASSAGRSLLPGVSEAPPYEGAKPMLLIESLDDRALIAKLFETSWNELPAPRKKR